MYLYLYTFPHFLSLSHFPTLPLSHSPTLIHPYSHTSSHYLIIQGFLCPLFRSIFRTLSLITYWRRLNHIITPPLLRRLLRKPFRLQYVQFFSKIENAENWKCRKSGQAPKIGAQPQMLAPVPVVRHLTLQENSPIQATPWGNQFFVASKSVF